MSDDLPGGPIDPEILFNAIHDHSASWANSRLVIDGASAWPIVSGNAWDLSATVADSISRETFDTIARATACTNGVLIIDGARKQVASVGGWAVIADL